MENKKPQTHNAQGSEEQFTQIDSISQTELLPESQPEFKAIAPNPGTQEFKALALLADGLPHSTPECTSWRLTAYCHLLKSKRGWPVTTEIRTVSINADTGSPVRIAFYSLPPYALKLARQIVGAHHA